MEMIEQVIAALYVALGEAAGPKPCGPRMRCSLVQCDPPPIFDDYFTMRGKQNEPI